MIYPIYDSFIFSDGQKVDKNRWGLLVGIGIVVGGEFLQSLLDGKGYLAIE